MALLSVNWIYELTAKKKIIFSYWWTIDKMKFTMNWFLVLFLFGLVRNFISTDSDENDGVSIEEEEPKVQTESNSYQKFIKNHEDLSIRIKRKADSFLNSYIKNLKDVSNSINLKL